MGYQFPMALGIVLKVLDLKDYGSIHQHLDLAKLWQFQTSFLGKGFSIICKLQGDHLLRKDHTHEYAVGFHLQLSTTSII